MPRIQPGTQSRYRTEASNSSQTSRTTAAMFVSGSAAALTLIQDVGHGGGRTAVVLFTSVPN
jgi:hypothetical protein